MLELDSVTLGHPGFRLQADVSVDTTARTALLGPSGGGKSTLLAAIAGFLAPIKGTIRLDGRDLTATPPAKRGMAIVFQDQNLFPHMTATQNVGLALSPRLSLSTGDLQTIDATLEKVGLAGLGNRKPHTLSGGQQARVTLARVMLQRAKLILLDEPFAALGPALSGEMLDLVASHCTNTGAGLLMVSHDPEVARALCPQTIVVGDGHAAPPAPTTDILANPPRPLARYLTGPAP